MKRYYCNNCGIETNTSECPVCKGRTETKSQIFWCDSCNLPIYEESCSICGSRGRYMSTDLRPVFPEERLLLEIVLGDPFKFINSSVWNTTGNKYFVDGKHLNISIRKITKTDANYIIENLQKYKDENNYDFFNDLIKRFVKANSRRFNYIVSEATEFIKDQSKGYDIDEMFISFSGGKDSTVTHDLTVKALSKPEIIHIFGDTTLEFPTTLEYVKRFKKNNPKTPLLTAKNKEQDFYEICDIVGPPARLMRWCCTIFKTGSITRKINGLFKDKNRILTFYGIRRSESASRSKYEREESEKTKILKQRVVSPIIDWLDFDVWLYIFTQGIDFNDAYRYGYARVGCWCCPNNSNWSEFLASIYMPDRYKEWRDYLINFAKKVGKPDAEVYVKEGGWKARQGGNGVAMSKNVLVSFKPCATEENAFNYELKNPISEQLYELFKPFGKVSKELGNRRLGEVYVLDKENNPIIKLQGRIGSGLLKVSIIQGNARILKQKIECQLTKYQLCIGCLACESVCRFNAILVKATDDGVVYKIDDEKCVRCKECVNHFDNGCYIKKVLVTRKDGQS